MHHKMTTPHRRRSQGALGLGLLPLAVLAGCGDGAHDRAASASASAGSGTAGRAPESSGLELAGAGGRQAPGKPAASFEVSLTVSGATPVCPGRCVQLTAAAERGVAPYVYSFDQGVGEGAGPHQVCPTETTTYRVTVSDSSGAADGDIRVRNAPVTQSITIAVDGGACADAGASAAPDGAVARPERSGTVACQSRLAAVRAPNDPGAPSMIGIWYFDFTPVVAVDAGDDAVLAVSYQGTFDLSDGTRIGSGAARGVLVAKVASDCRPLWFATVPALARDVQQPTVAVDSQGRIIVSAVTSVYNAQNTWLHDAIALTALSPDGQLLWSKQLGNLSEGYPQSALRIDAADDIVLLVPALAGSDFGGGVLGGPGPVEPTIEVLAKFDRDGNHMWSRLLQRGWTPATMAILNGTDILFYGWSEQSINWDAGGLTQSLVAGDGYSYLVRADADGNYTWSTRVSQRAERRELVGWIDVDRMGYLVMSAIGGRNELAHASAQGEELWLQLPVIDPDIGLIANWNKTALDADSNVILGGTFHQVTRVNGVTLSVSPGGIFQDAFVQKMNRREGVLWTYQTADTLGSGEWLLGIAADSRGYVFAAIGTGGGGGDELHLLKLAP
jgi:hypothetical protein